MSKRTDKKPTRAALYNNKGSIDEQLEFSNDEISVTFVQALAKPGFVNGFDFPDKNTISIKLTPEGAKRVGRLLKKLKAIESDIHDS